MERNIFELTFHDFLQYIFIFLSTQRDATVHTSSLRTARQADLMAKHNVNSEVHPRSVKQETVDYSRVSTECSSGTDLEESRGI